jgi:hypothetical protein
METMAGLTASTQTTTAAAAARRGIWRASPRFWVCLILLGGMALGLQTVAGWLGWTLQKEAVPLLAHLKYFDLTKLGPRFEKHPSHDRLPPPSDDMVDSLGTEEFLQAILTDTTKAANDPTRTVRLFVTYYTGKPDMVPHVPEECFVAAGYNLVGIDSAEVHARGVGAPHDTVPVRIARFDKGGAGEIAVATFFHVNGGYQTTRDGVRLKLSNPFARYAYYAKIDVDFFDENGRSADARATLAALPAVLETVLPVLFEDHIDVAKIAPPAAPEGG